MAKMFWEKDANPRALEGKRIAVIGYGSQGRAHALNLRDSKLDVVVGLRRGGASWTQAEQDGWKLSAPIEASKGADVVMMLAPDTSQPPIYANEIAPNLKAGSMLMFSHGFNIHYGQITPPKEVDVTMVAPKGPGNLVRLSNKTPRDMRSTARWPTRTLSAARGRASFRRPLPKRPKPICSASKPCSAAARVR